MQCVFIYADAGMDCISQATSVDMTGAIILNTE